MGRVSALWKLQMLQQTSAHDYLETGVSLWFLLFQNVQNVFDPTVLICAAITLKKYSAFQEVFLPN